MDAIYARAKSAFPISLISCSSLGLSFRKMVSSFFDETTSARIHVYNGRCSLAFSV